MIQGFTISVIWTSSIDLAFGFALVSLCALRGEFFSSFLVFNICAYPCKVLSAFCPGSVKFLFVPIREIRVLVAKLLFNQVSLSPSLLRRKNRLCRSGRLSLQSSSPLPALHQYLQLPSGCCEKNVLRYRPFDQALLLEGFLFL